MRVLVWFQHWEWLTTADVIVAEVTTPSLGVGYEIATAEYLNKKILCIYRQQEGRRLSAMINGNKKLKVILYKDIEDLHPIFANFFIIQNSLRDKNRPSKG